MKRALLFTSALIVAVAPAAMAADFGPIIIGAHFIPGVEATSSGRPWDFSISFGVGIEFDEQNSAEVHVVTDSHVTSVGLWGHFETLINERFGVGAGGTILWPIANQETFLQPVIETYARASVQWDSGAVTSGDLDVSFPIVTLADRGDHWDVIPLASLPSVSAGGGVRFADEASLFGRLTLSPILVDTTLLENPIGRITDRLLVLPTASAGLRYFP